MDKFIAKKCLIEDWGVSNGVESSDKINFTKKPKLIRKYDENYLICGFFFLDCKWRRTYSIRCCVLWKAFEWFNGTK